MKFRLLLLLLIARVALATTYTVSAPHLTMHAGDPVPPCIIQIFNGASYVSESTTLFTGAATCSIGANSGSPAGNYTITVGQGTLASLVGGDTISTINGQITVIPPDSNGAILSTVVYPPGMTSGTRFPALDVTNNGIANWVGDGTTDNAAAMLMVTAMGRGTPTATVNVASGATSTITQTGGTNFAGLVAGQVIKVDGLPNTIASVTDNTHLVTTNLVEGGAPLTGVQFEFPPWSVNTSGTAVTAVGGATFTGLTGNIIINLVTYTISSVTDSTHLVLTASAGTQTAVPMYRDPAACCSSGSGGSVPQALYIPAGVYATSQQFNLYLNYWYVFGVNPQTSIIKLLPNSPAFNTGSNFQFINPQSVGGNQNFHEFLYNVGIEIGVGNPNAIPFTTEMNNVASVRNVQIWADDSVCPYAFNLRRGFPGPALYKNVAIYGCTNALSSNQNEYTSVFENLTTEGQLGTVVDSGNQNWAFRHVLSDNTGQWFLGPLNGPYGIMSLLDSALLNVGSSATAITIGTGGSGYQKNVHVTGYANSITDSSTGSPVTKTGDIVQNWSGTAQCNFCSTPDSLHLTEKETPLPSDPAPSSWTQLDTNVPNWPTEFTNATSSTVYTVPGGYNSSSAAITINVPNSVNHIIFYQAKRTDNTAYTLTFNVATNSTTPLIIDGCIYTSCNVNHTGTRTVVLLDSTLNQYTASPGAGDLYIEDAILAGTASAIVPTFYSSQHVWARHLNLEAHNINKFDCEGCTIWVLGYKTEEPYPNIIVNAGGKAEIFTTFMYGNVAPVGPSQIILNDSSIFISSTLSKIDVAGRGNTVWVQETQGSTTRSIPTSTVNSTINLPMYYSTGYNPVAVPTVTLPRGVVVQ